MKRNYDETSVLRSLSRKGIKTNIVDCTITVPYNATNVGNGTWGKIDFLCNYKGYVLLREGNAINQLRLTDKHIDKEEKKINKVKKITKVSKMK